MRTFFVEIPVFKSHVYVVTGCSWEQYASHMKRKWNIDDDFSYLEKSDATAQTFDGEPYRSIWLQSFKGKPYDYGVLAHEATHCAIRICENKGIPVDSWKTADETCAYLVDYIVSEIIKKHRK